jgi:hypothetical protein
LPSDTKTCACPALESKREEHALMSNGAFFFKQCVVWPWNDRFPTSCVRAVRILVGAAGELIFVTSSSWEAFDRLYRATLFQLYLRCMSTVVCCWLILFLHVKETKLQCVAWTFAGHYLFVLKPCLCMNFKIQCNGKGITINQSSQSIDWQK